MNLYEFEFGVVFKSYFNIRDQNYKYCQSQDGPVHGDLKSFSSSESSFSFKLFMFKSQNIQTFFMVSSQERKKYCKTANCARRRVRDNLDVAI